MRTNTPDQIFTAMMRANSSESAAPQDRLYGLLSDYLRWTLTDMYGQELSDEIYSAAIRSGEYQYVADQILLDEILTTTTSAAPQLAGGFTMPDYNDEPWNYVARLYAQAKEISGDSGLIAQVAYRQHIAWAYGI